ncbi:MAG: nucleotide pyrophosphatase/phosphodiesterase family protein [Candidatus Binatia bacterium]
MMLLRVVALGALLAACVPARADARVLLMVVDGLDAREVTADVMPTLERAWRESVWCPNARSLAAMPTRTNTNHATLITGVQPEAHGITGNAFWDRKLGSRRKLGTANDLLTETIFTTAHRAGRGLRTAAAVGKPKLGVMFAADGDRQLGPNELWDARAASDAARDDVTGYAYDGTTLAAARALVEHAGADFLFINLSDVDRVSHGSGPQSPQAIETRRRTDAALAAFLGWLTGRADWASTTVVITADHGFDAVMNPALRFGDVLDAHHLDELVAVGDGGVGHVYLLAPGRAPAHDAETLATARRLALEQPGIADAVYLRPNKSDGGETYTLAKRYPDWHVGHERSGDLILVAKTGYHLVDGSTEEAKLVGNHGGPGERNVPAIVLGGGLRGTRERCDDIHAADLGRTVQACLGLPEVRRLDGRPIPADDRGRVLDGMCPVTPSTVVTVP